MRPRLLTESVGIRLVTALALFMGLLGGVLAQRKPSDALLICLVLGGVFGLALIGDRAFPWAIAIVAVAPWYPFLSEQAEAPIVRQKVLCAAIAAAPLTPWLWSLAVGQRRTRPSRAALLLGILVLGLTLYIYTTLGHVSPMINSQVVGYLFIAVTFLCARRFGEGRGWQAAAFTGLALLLAMGLWAYQKAPAARVGYFVGYPITYGALVTGLLPLALLFCYRRSRLLAAGLAALTAMLLIFSESRSSWVAATVVLLLAVVLQARAGNLKALGAVAAAVVVLTALVLGTGTLHHIVEQKLSAKVANSQSVTHREWSYGYALETIGKAPFFGAGEPGFSGLEAAEKTSIGAIDNGYLSITVDMGLVGLLLAIIPLAVALRVLARCLRFGVSPPENVALALGIVAMAVVTAFYDSFYWAQIDLLMAGMAGVLSTRVGRIGQGAAARGRRVALRPRRGLATRTGGGSWRAGALG